MSIDELIEQIQDLVDDSWSVPFSGQKSVIDRKRIMDLCVDLRLALPSEVKQARAIVSDRGDILTDAKKEADVLIKRAEKRARALVSEDAIVKAANDQAAEILNNAKTKAKEMRKTAFEYADSYLQKLDDALVVSVNEIKNARKSIREKK